MTRILLTMSRKQYTRRKHIPPTVKAVLKFANWFAAAFSFVTLLSHIILIPCYECTFRFISVFENTLFRIGECLSLLRSPDCHGWGGHGWDNWQHHQFSECLMASFAIYQWCHPDGRIITERRWKEWRALLRRWREYWWISASRSLNIIVPFSCVYKFIFDYHYI